MTRTNNKVLKMDMNEEILVRVALMERIERLEEMAKNYEEVTGSEATHHKSNIKEYKEMLKKLDETE